MNPTMAVHDGRIDGGVLALQLDVVIKGGRTV
jgi:hypothetical protein